LISVCVFLVAPLVAAGLPRIQPVAPDDALTMTAYRTERARVWREQLEAAYLALQPDPDPSDDARPIIRDFADRWANVKWHETPALRARIRALGPSVSNPTVRAIDMLLEGGSRPSATVLYDQIVDITRSLEPTPFPPDILLRLRLIGAMSRPDTEEWADQCMETASKRIVEVVDREGVGDIEVRSLLHGILDLRRIGCMSLDQLRFLIERLEGGPNTQWVRDILLGTWHRDTGWDARGTGFASTVTEEGWRVFGAHMPRATKAFADAHERAPHRPEAAAYLVQCAYAGFDDDDPAEWFERGFRAQFDWAPLYHNLAEALDPRWGGSVEELLGFASWCSRCTRFDTTVPDECVRIVHIVVRDYGGVDQVFESHTGWPALRRVYRGYGARHAETGDEAAQTVCLTALAATAWRAGEFGEAREALEQLGDRWDLRAARAYWAGREEVLFGVYAEDGPLSAALRPALIAESAGEWDAAAEALESAATKAPARVPLARLLRARAGAARAMAAAERGGRASFDFEDGLGAWLPRSGEWSIDADGTLRATPDDGGFFLYFVHPIEGDFEFGCTINFDRAGEDQERSGGFGLWPSVTDEEGTTRVYLQPGWNLVSVRSHRNIDSEYLPERRNPKQWRLEVRVENGQTRMTLDGKPLKRVTWKFEEDAPQRRYLALSGLSLRSPDLSTSVAFSDLTLRLLPKP